MSTPLKALIQERLRAKIVRRGPDYDFEDEYERDSNRLIRQPMEVATYELTSREEHRDLMGNTPSQGTKPRRDSTGSTNYPMRLHTHIDPSAYLIPSEHDGPYYPPSGAYEVNNTSSSSHGDHSRHRNSRYPREQYHETNLYDQSPRHEQQQYQTQNNRRHHYHHRAREQQQPHYEPTPRGGYEISHSNQSRGSVSPWHRPEHIPTASKGRSMTRSPVAVVTRSMRSPPSRGQRERDYTSDFDNGYMRHQQPDTKNALMSPESTNPKTNQINNGSHQPQNHSVDQRERYVWSDREHAYSNQASIYEVRGPSPAHHHRNHEHNYPIVHDAARYSLERRRHSIQTGSDNISTCSVKASSPAKPQSKDTNPNDKIDSICPIERQIPPLLSMDIIEPVSQPSSRTRAWDAILSPDSRLAAKAFVEKRQRRTDKGTPRTMATQRWLAVLDARAKISETKQ